MQANAEIGHGFGPPHRIGGSGRPHHQAGMGENPLTMRPFDTLVDGLGKPEIVGGDDDFLQAWRSRRNRKNSTPSRSRRFIICGLRTISLTMEAIFGARK